MPHSSVVSSTSTRPWTRSSSKTRHLSRKARDVERPAFAGIYRSSAPRLVRFSELAAWQQENEFIITGYRPASGSLVLSARSLLYVNNETVSTWSHLIGSIIFLALPFHFYSSIYPEYSTSHLGDLIVISIYLLGVSICFALSAICHIVWNHSAEVAAFGNNLDFLGILVLMWGASIPTIYYGFCNNTTLQMTYWLLMTLAALGCAVLTMSPQFNQPHFRLGRAMLFGSFGLTSILFIVHGLIIHGWAVQNQHMSLGWMAWMAGFNLLGAAAYASRIPERHWPCRFDIVGGSHQIFHMAVLVAACIHYVGLIRAFGVVRGQHVSMPS